MNNQHTVRFFQNELSFQNRAGFQSTNTSLSNPDDLDTIFMDEGNGYNPPMLRGAGGGLKFALPASVYRPYVDTVPQPSTLRTSADMDGYMLAQNNFFLRPNPHATATIPGCNGGMPMNVETAIRQGKVFLYD